MDVVGTQQWQSAKKARDNHAPTDRETTHTHTHTHRHTHTDADSLTHCSFPTGAVFPTPSPPPVTANESSCRDIRLANSARREAGPVVVDARLPACALHVDVFLVSDSLRT